MARARFLVVVSHDPDGCLDAIDETISQGPGFQEAYEWGCLVGNRRRRYMLAKFTPCTLPSASVRKTRCSSRYMPGGQTKTWRLDGMSR